MPSFYSFDNICGHVKALSGFLHLCSFLGAHREIILEGLVIFGSVWFQWLVFPGCISETVRCRKFILGRDIGWGGVGVQRHGLTLI